MNIRHQTEIRAPFYAQSSILSKRLEDGSIVQSSSHLKTAKTSNFPPLFHVWIFKLWYDKEDVVFSEKSRPTKSLHWILNFHPVCLVSSDNNSLRRYVPSKRHRSFRYQTLDFSWNHRWILVNSIEVNIGHQMEIRAPLYAENCTLSKSLEDDSMTLSSSHLKTAKTSKLSILFRLRTRCLVSPLTPWILTCCIFQAYH